MNSKNSAKAPYDVLYEDRDIIVVYKKRDVFSIRTEDKKTYSHNLNHYLWVYLAAKNERPYVVHRLDYETSGIMIFAKNHPLKEKLQALFEERKVGRYYEAVVKEPLPFGKNYHVDHYLEEQGFNSVVSTPEKGKEAITDILVQNPIQIGTALSISISTGRHNQIRVALASLGLTLLGDKRYANNEAKRLYLNEYRLSFPVEAGLAKTDFEVAPLWLLSPTSPSGNGN